MHVSTALCELRNFSERIELWDFFAVTGLMATELKLFLLIL